MSSKSRSVDLVRRLNELLGPTLVSTLAGSKDTRLALAWAERDGPQPDRDALDRLELAESVWLMVSEVEGDALARAWFTGANPWLHDDTAITAIREGRLDEVANAAQALVDDSFSG